MDIQAFLSGLRSKPNIGTVFFELAKALPDRTVYSQAEYSSLSPRNWKSENYSSVAPKVARLANYLASIGVTRGSRVSIISFSRPEWMIADLAILSLGAICVSIYQSVNRDETGYILYDSEAEFAFAENEEQTKKLLSLILKPCAVPATEGREAKEIQIQLKKIISFEQVDPHPLIIGLNEVLANAEIPQTIPAGMSAVTQDDIASLVYTSGTTGPPKGVIQTHGNHIANLWQAARTGLFAPKGAIYLFLPLAHSFARLIGYIGFLTPTVAKFPAIPDPKSSQLNATSVLRDMREGSAEVVPTVPRILEKMVSGVKEKALKGGLSGSLLSLTLRVAQEHYQAKGKAGLKCKLLNALVSPIKKKISRQLFGPSFSHIVSGGAKLPVSVGEFFASLNITILEGYGLTETCVATNVNLLSLNKVGSVGPCLAEVEIKIAEDEEILFRGPNIAKGYLNRPKATAEAWDAEGWFHTGDQGRLDESGYLFITGRKKELIVTAGGKKIAPAAIEEKLVNSEFISNAVIFGEGKPYCVSLILPDMGALKAWMATQPGNLSLNSPEVEKLFNDELAKVNAQLSKFETIKKFRLITDEFTVDNGFLTPTFKIKRGVVTKRYTDIIESMYSSSTD